MTKLEHFAAWAELLFPWIDRTTDERNGKVFFRDKHLQVAWMAFNHAFTVRPTTNTRLNAAEFMKDNPTTIVDRLNGIFPTADPPYKMSPLHYEAAREIERLRERIKELEVRTWREPVAIADNSYPGRVMWLTEVEQDTMLYTGS